MKKLKCLFILIILFIGIKGVNAFDNSLKVYDYAQVLTEKEENNLKTKINKYMNKYNIDMVIVTVKYYTQSTLDEYMNLFYNKNDFGIGNNKDGIILVLDLKNSYDNIGIQTFGRTVNFYSQNELENISNEINKEKGYYQKLNKFIDGSNEYIDNFDNIYIGDHNILASVNWLEIIILSSIIPTIIIIIGLLKSKNVKKECNDNYYIKKDSVVINKKSDKFITTNTKKERLNRK